PLSMQDRAAPDAPELPQSLPPVQGERPGQLAQPPTERRNVLDLPPAQPASDHVLAERIQNARLHFRPQTIGSRRAPPLRRVRQFNTLWPDTRSLANDRPPIVVGHAAAPERCPRPRADSHPTGRSPPAGPFLAPRPGALAPRVAP